MHHFTSMSQIICHAHLTHQGREKQTKPKSFDISPVVRCFYETNSPLALCIVSIQEQFLTKSGLQWRAYGRLKTQILNLIFPETNKAKVFLQKLPIMFKITFMRHYKLLLIKNCFCILPMHKDRISEKNYFKTKKWSSKMGQ